MPDRPHVTNPFRTALGVGLFLVPLVFSPWGGTFLPVKRGVLYATLIACAAICLRGRDIRFVSTPVSALGLGYVALAVLSAFWATNPFLSAVEAGQLVALLALAFLGVSTLRPGDLDILARYVAAAGLLVAGIGILQYFGVSLPIPSAGQPSATLSFRNIAAAYVIAAIPVAGIAWRTDPHPLRRAVWLVAALAMALLLAYTRSRGAWLGLLAGAAASGLYLLRAGVSFRLPAGRWAAVGLFILGFGLLATRDPVSVPGARQQFDIVKSTAAAAATSIADPGSDRGRLVFWRKTLDMIRDHPLLGVGLDNWEIHYPRYDRGAWNVGHSESVRPHNDLLWNWSELGIFGAICFTGFVWLPVVGAFRDPRPRGRPAMTAGLIAAAVALFVHGLFSFLREQPAPSMMLWFSIAGLVLTRRPTTPVSLPRAAVWPTLLFGAAALIVSFRHGQFAAAYGLAEAAHDRGDPIEASRQIDRAVAAGPFDHRAHFLRGRIFQTAGRPEAAIDAYERALRYHPYYAHTHHNLGGAYAAAGDPNRAIAHIRTAIRIRPTYDQARINLANTLVGTGALREAREVLTPVLGRNGGLSAEAHGLTGAILLHEGEATRAIAHLEAAVSAKPDYAEAYNNLGVAYESVGRPDRAADAYGKLIEHWQGDPAYLETVRERFRQLTEQRP